MARLVGPNFIVESAIERSYTGRASAGRPSATRAFACASSSEASTSVSGGVAASMTRVPASA